jgi:hypothetical protein
MITTKRYLCFGGENYYPTGPSDYVTSVDSLEEFYVWAAKYLKDTGMDWTAYMDLGCEGGPSIMYKRPRDFGF